MTNHHPIAIAAAALALSAPIAASAAQTPLPPPPARGPAQPPQPPPGGPRPRGGPPAPTSGVITSSRPYHVVLAGPAGRTIALTLRQGTIIDPRGTTLVPGMRVTYTGRPLGDGTILTDRIALGGPIPGGAIPGGPADPRGPRHGGPPPPPAAGPRPAPPVEAQPPSR